jgi:predicted kinase
MKPRPMLQSPGAACDERGLNDGSAEAAVYREMSKLAAWLAAQGIDVQNDHANADEGSRDRLYLHYGYFIGLKRALAMLTKCGQTVH